MEKYKLTESERLIWAMAFVLRSLDSSNQDAIRYAYYEVQSLRNYEKDCIKPISSNNEPHTQMYFDFINKI